MTVWAGKLVLSLEAQARLKVTDRYSIHRVLTEFFSDSRNPQMNSPSGFLWVDKGQTVFGRRIDFLSQSLIPNIPIAEDVFLDFKEIPQDFLEHEYYRFQIVVNPSKCIRDGLEKINGRLVSKCRRIIGLLNEDEIEQWFLEKTSDRGVDVSVQSIDGIGKEIIYKKDQRVVLAKSRITGILKVKDRETFKNLFLNGLGRGKSFGFGFLQIAALK